MTGIGASLVLPKAFPSIPALMAFPYIFVVSLIGCIVGSLLSEPDDEVVLMRFYMQVRPWGIWKPVLAKVRKHYPEFESNRNFLKDLFNVFVGVIWQTSLVTIPIALVTQQYTIFLVALILMLTMAVILKFSWWNTLDQRSENTLPPDFEQRVGTAAHSR
jgi:solute:Na+ symporter, SSS family